MSLFLPSAIKWCVWYKPYNTAVLFVSSSSILSDLTHHTCVPVPSGTHRFIGSTRVHLALPPATLDLATGTKCCCLKITISGSGIPWGRGPTTHSRFQSSREKYRYWEKKRKNIIPSTQSSLLPTRGGLPLGARDVQESARSWSLPSSGFLSVIVTVCVLRNTIYMGDGHTHRDDINHIQSIIKLHLTSPSWYALAIPSTPRTSLLPPTPVDWWGKRTYVYALRYKALLSYCSSW
jgi:hypothetical protein